MKKVCCWIKLLCGILTGGGWMDGCEAGGHLVRGGDMRSWAWMNE